MAELLRLAAFTLDPAGGNPAGVWIGAAHPDDAEMLRIAADVGYSETAFLAPDGTDRPGAYRVRYFSPVAEVPFCGHATIATGVALAERSGPGRFDLTTNGGLVPVDVERRSDGRYDATLTSVEPSVRDADSDLLAEVLAALGWTESDLDPALPPAVAYAGASHLVLSVAAYDTLAAMAYALRPHAGRDARGGPDDRPARLARGTRSVPGARPICRRWRRRGSCDRGRRGGTRSLPSLAW
jgi:PhzF family phenazine biosynthesis protein